MIGKSCKIKLEVILFWDVLHIYMYVYACVYMNTYIFISIHALVWVFIMMVMMRMIDGR